MCVARKQELEEYIEVLSFSLCVETAAVGPVVNTMSALSQKKLPDNNGAFYSRISFLTF